MSYRVLSWTACLLFAGCAGQVKNPSAEESRSADIKIATQSESSPDSAASSVNVPSAIGLQSAPLLLKPPAQASTDFVQAGRASWYGKKFQGRRTASGERFDMHALTAAHRTLPFGTYVRVSNGSKTRSVIVRINDRGPYIKGRVIDLSLAAARMLGLREIQAGPVILERVGERNRLTPSYTAAHK
ncbi:RlpA-like lipoprotein [Caballeronia arvi]|uniref:Endolytic peptidoglycan transglycosylase RlpA n=1 Tax=Caballeronia arvi TaxID=1777135 RepID=A0A158JL67_9BURK|nr:septal ring lytic transglycosylase RlpA family protein [Caballeronia arvi]SAL69604.1 RlpA-like lipoprotein [Caballeronia arvi]